jgi:5-methylcytosine-specific restriction endonuclease McrA
MRARVWARDNGICALCGVDTKTMRRPVGVWDADHIVPVSEGGGLCGLEGMRTLCRKCHGSESGKLRKRLNERVRLEEVQRKTGKLF